MPAPVDSKRELRRSGRGACALLDLRAWLPAWSESSYPWLRCFPSTISAAADSAAARRGEYWCGMKFVSLMSVFHALKERPFWAFCAAMATDKPVAAGPNLRLL